MTSQMHRGRTLSTRRGRAVLAIAAAFYVATVESSSQQPPARAASAEASGRVVINRKVPSVSAVPLRPVFSPVPTAGELRGARVFTEPLLPLGVPTPAENHALAAAVTRYTQAARPLEIQPFAEFLNDQPTSVWRASLQANLAPLYRASGFYTRALRAWDEAWNLSKDDSSPHGRAVADLAAGGALDMLASMGQAAALDRWLVRTEGRTIAGPAAARADRAREVRALIATRPDRVIPSGPKAIEILLGWRARQKPELPHALATYRATAAGTTLRELQALAAQAGLPMKAMRRDPGAPLVAPAIVHLGFDHFTAVLEEKNGQFRLRDPALGGEVWMTREALDEEMSGAALIADAQDAPGWRAIDPDQAAAIVGHSCPPGLPDPDECPCPESSPGMPSYSLHPVQASVLLADAPLEYSPARGPWIHLQLRYNHREENQPQTFAFANLGTKWTMNWLSYVEEVPFTAYTGPTGLAYAIPAHIAAHVPQGGVERFQYEGPGGVFERHYRSAAVLVHVSDSPLTYERRHTDGSKEVYSTFGGGLPGTRRVFLSAIVDAHGQTLAFTWDAQSRLVAVADALGQVTTVEYDDADPLKITSVTDPFGRVARMTYDAVGHLTTITDVVDLTSSFVYGDADFIVALRTPYGLTTFRKPAISGENARAIEAIDPLGGVERLEFWWTGAPVPASVPAGDVPAGFESSNDQLNTITSLHWKKGRAIGDVQQAVAWRWLVRSMDWYWDPGWSVGVPHSVQRPGETRLWYAYTGSTIKPSRVARKLPDGGVYEIRSTYNYQDRITWTRDPVGRETTYTYAPNGLDLQTVRNTTAGRNDLLASYSNYTSGHRPQTAVDADGQVSQTTYTAAGRIATFTTPKQETTTYSYDADGYLRTVTGPVAGAITTYTYDAYGRLRSATRAGEAEVTTEYDALNRPLRTTYPDGTYQQTIYDKLDPAVERDRLGRVTRFTYDADRRLIASRDPAGRVVQQTWCVCGGLEALIDGNGNITRWERDAIGRIVREIRADGSIGTSYTYDAVGRLHTATDALQQITTYTYNADGSIAALGYANAQHATPGISWSYDPAYRRVVTMTDATGTTAYSYHPVGQPGAGQVSMMDGPLANDAVTYAYDELRRATTRAVAGVQRTVAYDALGRISTQVDSLGTFTYAYDGVSGRLASATYPNGQASTYDYFPSDQEHRLKTILHRYPNGITLSKHDYQYDPVGNILSWTRQADTITLVAEHAYDRTNQLTGQVTRATDPQGTVVQRRGYGYDAAQNRVLEQIDDAVTTSTHDRLNRLVTSAAGGLLRVEGTLNEPAIVRVQGQPATVDASGGFVGSTPVTAGTTRFSVTATDASGNVAAQSYDVDQTAAAKAFVFDANGNLTSDGTRSFEWDAKPQLIAVTIGAARVEFTYDGRGLMSRRVGRQNGAVVSDERYIWCDTGLCERRDGSGQVLERYFEHGSERAGVLSFHTTDHLGSVTEVIAANQLVTRFDYDPFGRVQQSGAATEQPVFAGLRGDTQLGLFFASYRAYDASLGRWLSFDPAGTRDGPNLFAYAASNPVNLTDPSGLSDWKEKVTVNPVSSPFVAKSQCASSACGACASLSGYTTAYCTGDDCQGRMKMTFNLTAKVTVFSGNYKMFGLVNNCTPHDKSVVDQASAETHERGHISDIKAMVVAAMDQEEGKPYPSKDACTKEVKAAIARVNNVYQQAVKKTQASKH